MKKKKLGLSFRGGGFKAVAYAGFLKAVDESKEFEVGALVGASGGALVSVLYSFGLKPDVIREAFQDVNYFRSFSIRAIISNQSLINFAYWEEKTRALIGDTNLEDGKVKVYVQAARATDCSVQYFSRGATIPAILASAAIVSGYRIGDMHYFDGEYGGEFGANILRTQKLDSVIGVYLKTINEDLLAKTNILTPIHLMRQKLLTIDLEKHPVDHLIKIDTEIPGDIFKKSDLPKIYDRGYFYGKELLETLSNSEQNQ